MSNFAGTLLDSGEPLEPGDRVVIDASGLPPGVVGHIHQKDEFASARDKESVFAVQTMGRILPIAECALIRSPYQNEILEEVPRV